jgi:hypothetical protein
MQLVFIYETSCKICNSPKNCATPTSSATSCTFLEKRAIGLELIALFIKKYASANRVHIRVTLFIKICATPTGFRYELHFSRETCNRPWISCTFIKKYASSNIVLIRVTLLIKICATITGFLYALHFFSRNMQLVLN